MDKDAETQSLPEHVTQCFNISNFKDAEAGRTITFELKGTLYLGQVPQTDAYGFKLKPRQDSYYIDESGHKMRLPKEGDMRIENAFIDILANINLDTDLKDLIIDTYSNPALALVQPLNRQAIYRKFGGQEPRLIKDFKITVYVDAKYIKLEGIVSVNIQTDVTYDVLRILDYSSKEAFNKSKRQGNSRDVAPPEGEFRGGNTPSLKEGNSRSTRGYSPES